MPSKELNIPPEAAQAFLQDLRRYHATGDKRTGYAIRQRDSLAEYQPGVTMEDVYELFRQMKGKA